MKGFDRFARMHKHTAAMCDERCNKLRKHDVFFDYFIFQYMGKYGILASSALMFNVASFSSLLFTVHTTCNTSSFNWMYLFGNVVAQILLITYGVANKSPEIYIPTLFLFSGLLYIIYKKLTCHSLSPSPPTPHSVSNISQFPQLQQNTANLI